MALNGGKGMIATWIVSLMPEHIHYVEPYFGGGSVLFRKPVGASEVVNDLDEHLINFWCVLQDEEMFRAFARQAQAVPLSEAHWEAARVGESDDPVERAVDFFVMVRQSMAGRKVQFTPLSSCRTRRGMNDQASAWLGAVEGLADAHARLKGVVILHRAAIDVLHEQDGPNTLFYLDPPYLHETRMTVGEYGEYEMNRASHVELLNTVIHLEAKVMLSAYPSQLYDDALLPHGWTPHTRDVPNNASHARKKGRETEVVWTNY